MAKRSRYRAIKTPYAGITYDSKAEADRAKELDRLKDNGDIEWWIRQVTVTLGVPENKYRLDFLVAAYSGMLDDDRGGAMFVWAEDVKGFETMAFKKIKRLWRVYGQFPLHVIGIKKTVVIRRES